MDDLSGSDLLHGVAAIGAFLGVTKARADHMIRNNPDMPIFRLGERQLCARRSALRTWIAAREAASQALKPSEAS